MTDLKGTFDVNIKASSEEDAEKENKRFERCFRFYEKAIEGRNFHYSNYNTWANLYAIFTGAIFVGFYTIGNGNELLRKILCLLGFLASFCWFQAVRGYYRWMISWINLVHRYEERLRDLSKHTDKYFVYDFFDKSIPSSFFHKNVSTQKTTVLFVTGLQAAWIYLIVKNFNGETRMVVIFAIIILICMFELLQLFSSSVSKMKSNFFEE